EPVIGDPEGGVVVGDVHGRGALRTSGTVDGDDIDGDLVGGGCRGGLCGGRTGGRRTRQRRGEGEQGSAEGGQLLVHDFLTGVSAADRSHCKQSTRDGEPPTRRWHFTSMIRSWYVCQGGRRSAWKLFEHTAFDVL